MLPAATALACRLFGIDPLSAAAAVLFTAAPISASSYVLARQLGGDAPMLAGLITITTIAAVAGWVAHHVASAWSAARRHVSYRAQLISFLHGQSFRRRCLSASLMKLPLTRDVDPTADGEIADYH